MDENNNKCHSCTEEATVGAVQCVGLEIVQEQFCEACWHKLKRGKKL